MLDSINVAMTGLTGFSQGLRVIANNTANLDTPGYKGSTLQFRDLVGPPPPSGTPDGQGVETAGTHLDLRQGELRQTGQDLDLAVDGEGLFVLQDIEGRTRFTRAGTFEFNADGVLVDRSDASRVMGSDGAGGQAPIVLTGLRAIAGQATTTLRFTGNLSSTSTGQTVDGLTVYDSQGGQHTLSLRLSPDAAGTPDRWQLELLESGNVVGSGSLVFENGAPGAATARTSLRYAPAGRAAQDLLLDFSTDVTSFASGSLSTLALSGQDGGPPGSLVKLGFDDKGVLVASYDNGRTQKGPRLMLARFVSPGQLQPLGGNRFAAAEGARWETGLAGEGGFGALRSGVLEFSNVDLSSEFSRLIVMQRGYEASSQVIATASQMLQQLFQIRGG